MTTGVDEKHPQYQTMLPYWEKMRRTIAGEESVKEARDTYLPFTAGQILDGAAQGGSTEGGKRYSAYLSRAVFHEFPGASVTALMSLLHKFPAEIELPKELEPLRKKATNNGEGLEMLLRRINREQLSTGRMGLLLDLPSTRTAGSILPYIVTYEAESITNWDDGRRNAPVGQNLNLVVLNETEQERTDFTWQEVEKYRVLWYGDFQANESAEAKATYFQQIVREDSESLSEVPAIAPKIQGKTLDFIPFVFVNVSDILPRPELPVLRGLANLSLSIYRMEADYRQNLYLQGQATFVISGAAEDTDIRVGSDTVLILPPGAQAEYVGVSAEGLEQQAHAIDENKKVAAKASGQLIDTTSRQRESGEALKQRAGASTVTLFEIAINGARALEEILRMAAIWVDANPDEVKVTPNLVFHDGDLSARDLLEFEQARAMGSPVSRETLHKLMKRNGITEMEYEEEMRLIERERELDGGMFGAEGIPNPNANAGGMETPSNDEGADNEN